MPGNPPPVTDARPLVFLFSPGSPEVAVLRRTYPGTERIVPEGFPDRNFGVYYVPRAGTSEPGAPAR